MLLINALGVPPAAAVPARVADAAGVDAVPADAPVAVALGALPELLLLELPELLLLPPQAARKAAVMVPPPTTSSRRRLRPRAASCLFQ